MWSLQLSGSGHTHSISPIAALPPRPQHYPTNMLEQTFNLPKPLLCARQTAGEVAVPLLHISGPTAPACCNHRVYFSLTKV